MQKNVEAIKQAKKVEKKGDDCLKTGLFNWSKDLAGAATYYDEAAKTFFDNEHYNEVKGESSQGHDRLQEARRCQRGDEGPLGHRAEL